MASRVVTMLDDGYVPLFPLERTAVFLAIYASVTKLNPPDYRNYRFPLEKGFLGYYQFFDGQAVSKSGPLEFQSQLLWKNYDCCQLTFLRICELAAYLKSATNAVTTGISATANGIGVSVSPSFSSPFPAFEGILPTVNPSALAFKLEPGCVGELTIISESFAQNPCIPEVGATPEPDGCGGMGTPAPQMPRSCLPVPPGGGST